LKLTTKVYLLQFILGAVLLSFLLFTYTYYKKQYKTDMQNYVDSRVEFYKNQMLVSYNQAAKSLLSKKQLLKQIHKDALKILRSDMNRDLEQLKKDLSKKFYLGDLELNIFLIDKDYIIYKTTFVKDLGLNLGLIKEAKVFLDKTTHDGKIYMSEFLSTDALDMKYKFYATSFLKDNIYLETGITGNNIESTLKHIIMENKASENKIKIYTIFEDETKYYYSDMSAGMKKKSKEQWLEDRKYILKTKHNYNDIIQAYLSHKTVIEQKANIERVYVPFFDQDMYAKFGLTNVIMQLDIDITPQIQALKRFENIFFVSVAIIILFLIFIFFLIKNNFTKPIESIIKSINRKEAVHDTTLLEKKDELGIVAKEYNMLLKSLQQEIDINTKLLEENKRFIADTVHQIRTPLTNIMMNSDMVKLTVQDTASDEFIDQINSSINMLTNSYEDLSYIISHDSIAYTPVTLSLSEILKQRIAFFRTIAKVNHKRIVANIQDGITIKINQIELERIIDNNISNAVKYADVDKPITISLEKNTQGITLSFASYAEPIQNRSKLFEKNYRENESKRGLGLGLNMVKSICEKYAITYAVVYEEEQNIFIYKFKV
jgi:signal transduction histidine kinase